MNTLTTTAVYAGKIHISYGLMICIAALFASWMLTCALAYSKELRQVERVGTAFGLILYLPLEILAGAGLGRFIYWYSHFESYSGLAGAFSVPEGAFHEAGIVIGAFIAAGFCALFSGRKMYSKFVSAAASGTMLFMTLVSLIALFNDTDRGKAVIEDPEYFGLPFSILTGSGQDAVYRPAVFFWKFIILSVIAVISISLCIAGRKALLSYVAYFAAMAVLDSARYDASFLRSNGFVSLMQVVSGVFMILAFLYCLIRAARSRGFKFWHFLYILAFLSGLGLTGYMEYYVQRHGDLYIYCYVIMSAACFVMAATIWRLDHEYRRAELLKDKHVSHRRK